MESGLISIPNSLSFSQEQNRNTVDNKPTTKNKKLGSFFQFSGDLTYALYLLHIPTQIIIILAFGYFDMKEDIFYSEFFFIGYVGFVILITSFISSSCLSSKAK